MLERLPWFKLCPADYLLDTLDLTHAEHGIYCILIFTYYWQGGLPSDPTQLHRIARAQDPATQALVDGICKRYFRFDGQKLVHARIERELHGLQTFLTHQSAAGKASAAKRQNKLSDAPAKVARPSKGNGKAPPANDSFTAFWDAYPRHEARASAAKAWAKLNPDEALQGRILQAVAAQKASAQWQRDGGKYVPHPATWLNARRWEDEAPAAQEERFPI